MTPDDSWSRARAKFLMDVADHQMAIRHSDGVYSHLAFRHPDHFMNSFQITTWPHYLCISGDAGDFVFSRLPDMFEFFRGSQVNCDHWAEKLTATDRHTGHRTFSPQLYRKALEDDFACWTFDSERDRRQAWGEMTDGWDGLLSAREAVEMATNFECGVSGQTFTDFWDHELEEHSPQFLWCCHAIQWAIARYDETAMNPPGKAPA